MEGEHGASVRRCVGRNFQWSLGWKSAPPTAYTMGFLLILGPSEFTDYPILGIDWDVSEPMIKHASNVTLDVLTSPADSATEGMLSSAEFTVWWTSGIAIAALAGWVLML